MRVPDEFDYADWLDHQTDLGREHSDDNWPVCSDECPAGGDHHFVTDAPMHIGARWPEPHLWYCAECHLSAARYLEGDTVIEADDIDPIDRLTFPTPADADADLARIAGEAWLLSQTDWNTP